MKRKLNDRNIKGTSTDRFIEDERCFTNLFPGKVVIPPDCMWDIFRYFDYKDLKAPAQTSFRWRLIVKREYLDRILELGKEIIKLLEILSYLQSIKQALNTTLYDIKTNPDLVEVSAGYRTMVWMFKRNVENIVIYPLPKELLLKVIKLQQELMLIRCAKISMDSYLLLNVELKKNNSILKISDIIKLFQECSSVKKVVENVLRNKLKLLKIFSSVCPSYQYEYDELFAKIESKTKDLLNPCWNIKLRDNTENTVHSIKKIKL